MSAPRSFAVDLTDPGDPPERRIEKLLKISDALMRRVEQSSDDNVTAYAHFQKAVMLEEQVRDRTRDLEKTLALLNDSNARLAAANDAAQKAREDLANALEAVEEGFALFDPDGAMVMCNSRFCRPMPDVWPALHAGMSFDDYIDLVSRSDSLDLREYGSAAEWATRRRDRHRDRHSIFNARLKDGVWLQVSEHRTPAGGTAILQTDITDMIRTERAERDKLLDDQARMVQATLDHIIQGVCIFDAGGRLVGWNRRLGALLSPPIQLVRLGARFSVLLDHIERGVVFGEEVSGDTIRAWVAQDGRRPPLSFDMQYGAGLILSVFAQEAPDHGFVISFTDVTAEREAITALFEANSTLERRVKERTLELEDALKDAERANATKSRFVAAASHDLLQPLSAAKLFLASLPALGVEGEAASVVQRASSALGSVEGILDALLDISKLDSGKAVITRTAVPLSDILRRLEDEFALIASRSGLDLRFVTDTAIVDSDASYLRRILQNLIANAVRYTTRGGVVVGTRRRGDHLRIEVWDTGPGVPVEKRADIFKEFQRLDRVGNAAEGMGLGLTIVDRACRLLGHELEMVSVVGRGTRFAVTVPLIEMGAGSGAAMPGSRTEGPGRLVLIIDDDAAFDGPLVDQIETWGMATLHARSADDALSLLDETGVTPDVVLIGFETGIIAIDAVRAAHGPLPAIVLATGLTPDISRTCAAQGLPLLTKPIDEISLFEALMRAE